MINKKEKCRVTYICSTPEWYGHNVNDMFFRLPNWLFVPVQDLSPKDRINEYKKATYFFVSGYGRKEEASLAHKEGCILVGVRGDVEKNIPVVECGEWDPVDVFVTFSFVEWSRFLFKNNSSKFGIVYKTVNFLIIRIVRPCFKIFFLVRAAINVWRTQGLLNVFIKTRNYFRKVMHI